MRIFSQISKPVISSFPYLTTGLILNGDTHSLGLSNGANCTEFSNQVSGQNEGVQATSNYQALAVTGETPASKTAISFDGVNDFYSFGNILSGLSQASFYFLVKLASSYTSSAGAIANNSVGGGSYNHYGTVYTNIYEGLGSTTRRSYTAPGNLASWHLMNITTKANEYKIYNNANEVYSSTSNTVSFPSDFCIGKDGFYLEFKMLKLFVYDVAHSASEVSQMRDEFENEYSLTLT